MDYTEFPLGNTSDLRDGEMKEVSAGQTKILLARVGDDFHAVSPTCPHYGAPLVEGTLCGTRVMCPWHHACFNVANGDLEEPPALDALVSYDVRVRDGRIFASLPAETQDRRTPSLSKHDPAADSRNFVIIGGGAAGYAAAQTLREDGFRGRIVLITREDRAPYDRPNLSKDYLQGHAETAWMPLRPDEFYDECDIELLCNKEVTRVDARSKTITLEGGESQTYDALLVATGGESRKLNIPGADLKNVYLLRSFADADLIMEGASRSLRAVVVGASFIGMEVAYSLAERGLEVTVVAPSGEPFERTLGAEVGALFRRLHESHNVQFKLGSIVYRFEGVGRVQAVVLESGELIETDMVVAGVGVHPVTGFLNGVGLNDDGGVIVDAHLRAAEDLYAAGDIASYPDPRTGERVRIEHWRTAQQQGRTAAHNMMGRGVPFEGVPFFWTRQFDAGLLYVGHASAWDEIVYQGEVSSCDFLAFYAKDGRVVAVAGMNRARDMAAVEELFRLDCMPTPARLKERATDFVALLGKAGRKEGRGDGVGERAA
ncbi:MAG TPA: FAD-dependent oxidoreductase [Pyrinomonadaceae bacterium]|jgi:NADPH-dependent 2,4-dienoyl-CoA reductase/sulfur reductase-like enzyme/nitrite reductase/ring-hydroxylating ferredoxin subunit